MLQIHHLNDSRSQRILWLLEELSVEYEIIKYQRDPDTQLAPRALRRIHPLGKAPVITHEGKTVAETGAIVEYIVDTFGRGRLRPPPESEDYSSYRYWLHYAEGSAMTPLLLKLIFTVLPSKVPFVIRPLIRAVASKVQGMLVDPQIATHAAYWEGALAKSDWFAGAEFTAADIMMSFPLEAATTRTDACGPNAKRFVATIHARPAYQRALERGGEYAYA